MGPLVPFIFSNEFNLVIALIVGFGFGFVLEQAGFSSTKKLVGLFFGYDFTVLKVFFTAGVTAMIGVVLLAHFGLLDMSLVYINPTFVKSALVGGAIMGLGFIIGGFCPGTSVCAASIGKLDGLAFVFGSVLGVLVFVEGYPLFEKIYLADNWGPVLINEKLGMSKTLFAFILTAFAVAAFYFTRLIENKVNSNPEKLSGEKKVIYASAVATAFVVLLVVAITPDSKTRMESAVQRDAQNAALKVNAVSADKLADEIVNNYYKINVIDTRSPEAYKAYHLPLAINIPVEKMGNREWQSVLNQKHKANYFYADNETDAKKALLWAARLGNAENYMLTESAKGFQTMFTNLAPPAEGSGKNEQNAYIFRKKAADDMARLVEAFKSSSQPVAAKATKIKGGC